MNGIDFVKASLEMSNNLCMGLIDDLKDAPLTFPTEKGGNHALWILGHLTYSEANLTYVYMQGKTNPLASWKDKLAGGSQPVADASAYPSMDEMLAKSAEIRENTLKIVNSLSDEDLDQPAIGCPDEMKDYFGTYGQCLMTVGMHPMMHYGQLADARRTLGRPPIMA